MKILLNEKVHAFHSMRGEGFGYGYGDMRHGDGYDEYGYGFGVGNGYADYSFIKGDFQRRNECS